MAVFLFSDSGMSAIGTERPLVINAKTAKALDLNALTTPLARAEKVE